MKTRMLISAATEKELQSVKGKLYNDKLDIEYLLTGLGSAITIYSLMRYLRISRPDYIINIGIAGSFGPEHQIGDTLVVKEDIFADLGVESQTGFATVWEEGLADYNEFPFDSGLIHCDPMISQILQSDIKMVRGITVNTASGNKNTIRGYITKYKPDIETMEVAAALYVGRMENIPVIALRSVSNFIEPREKGNWDIEKALAGLERSLGSIISKIAEG